MKGYQFPCLCLVFCCYTSRSDENISLARYIVTIAGDELKRFGLCMLDTYALCLSCQTCWLRTSVLKISPKGPQLQRFHLKDFCCRDFIQRTSVVEPSTDGLPLQRFHPKDFCCRDFTQKTSVVEISSKGPLFQRFQPKDLRFRDFFQRTSVVEISS